MPYSHNIRIFVATTLSVLALLTFAPSKASAHSHVSIGIGVGFPIYPGYGYGHVGYYHRPHFWPHHRAYFRPYYRPYFAPLYAPVIVPPPVVYAPPVAYPAPVYEAPVEAVPSSDIYQAPNGQYCREYQSTTRIAGRLRNVYGTACQDAGGTWRIVN